MPAARQAGFTLVELLVVVGIVGLLAAALLPALTESREQFHIQADERNLRQLHQWLEIARSPAKSNGLPAEGGHKLLLDLWVKQVVEPTVENFDRFFTPGPTRDEDAHYHELRKQVDRRERIWTELSRVTPDDTHYAARAKAAFAGMSKGDEALAANDNESRGGPGWAFDGGTVNILWGNGNVRPLSLASMMEQFQWPGREQVFKTWGPDSPHPALQKLDH